MTNKLLVTGIACTAMATAAYANDSCFPLPPLTAIEVSGDNIVLKIDTGGNIQSIIIDGEGMATGEISLIAANENGLISNAAVDLITSMTNEILVIAGMQAHLKQNSFDDFTLTTEGFASNLDVVTSLKNTGVVHSTTYQIADNDMREELTVSYGKGSIEAIDRMVVASRNVMNNYTAVVGGCTIQATALQSEGGMLRPQARPFTP